MGKVEPVIARVMRGQDWVSVQRDRVSILREENLGEMDGGDGYPEEQPKINKHFTVIIFEKKKKAVALKCIKYSKLYT